MSIPETVAFDKDGRGLIRRLFLALIIILVAALSFGAGRLTGEGRGRPVRIEFNEALGASAPVTQTAAASAALPTEGVVASKAGSKYHYPSCPGAKQIKEANRISFVSARAAEAAGYTLASNCKGP